MDTEPSDHQTAAPRNPDAADADGSPERDIRAEVAAQREKIRQDLRALRRDLQIFQLPELVRQHPIAAAAGAGVLGFIVSRLLFGGSAGSRSDGANEELLNELLDAIVEDAAHRVAAGADTREALRTTLREHGPIVLEVEREDEQGGPGLTGSLLHAAFELSEPYLRRLAAEWLEGRLSPPQE